MKVPSFYSALLALTLSTLAIAQNGRPDTQAEDLLDAAAQAHGGTAAILSQSDSRTQGLLNRSGQGLFDISILSRGFDRLRVEIDGRGSRKTYVNDGRFAWSVEGVRRRQLGENRAANQLNPYNPALGLLRAHLQGRLRAQYLGQIESGGIPCHRLLVWLTDADAARQQEGRGLERRFEVLIEDGTYLIAEMAVVSSDWDSESPELWNRWAYFDYRHAEGLAVPFQILQYSNGAQVAEITVAEFAAAQLGSVFQEPEN